MKVLVQWAKATPSDWEEIDSADWNSLADKGPSSGRGTVVDENDGWINAVSVQGVIFSGDCVAVEELGDRSGGIRVTLCNDDAGDGWDEVTRHARVIEFRPCVPDSRFGGALNVRQQQTAYTDDPVFATTLQNTTVERWSNFTKPSNIRHGVWLSDALYQDHIDARSIRGWREWVEGLDPSELDGDGLIKQQREQGRYEKPRGTRTFFHNATDLATGVHAATHENELGAAAAGAATENSGNITDALVWASTTPANQPDSPAWFYGNYRHQIDCVTADVGLAFGLLNQGVSAGHFARVNAALTTELETKQQVEAAFTGTGLKLATTGLVAWASGTITDRFEIAISVFRVSGMGNLSIDLQLGESDDFTDGPWLAVGEVGAEVNDAIVVADQTSWEFAVTIDDAVIVEDTEMIEIGLKKFIDNNADVVDQIIVETDYVRIQDDAVSVVDQVTAEVQIDEQDAIAVVDQVAAEVEFGRELSDSVAVADQVAREATFGRVVDDAVAVVDQAAITTEPSQADAVAVVDAVAREATFGRVVDDAVVVVDQVAITTEPSQADVVAVVDAVATEMSFGRFASDAVVVADQVAREHDAVRVADDAVAVVDQVAREHDAVRVADDAIEIVDQTDITTEPSQADAISVVDQVTRVHDANRIVDDVVVVADQAVRAHDANRTVDDAAVVVDQVARVHDASRTVDDAVAVVDTVVTEMSFSRTASDDVEVVDQIETAIVVVSEATDSIAVADQVARVHDANRIVDDVVAVSDSAFAQSFTAGDAVAVEDEAIVEFVKGASVSDTIEVTDLTLASIEFLDPDAVVAEDEVVREVCFVRSVDDAIVIAEVGPLLGDVALLVHGIDGGITDGPVQMSVVSPTGPLAISSGTSCDTVPVGFVVVTGDHVEWNDSVKVEVA